MKQPLPKTNNYEISRINHQKVNWPLFCIFWFWHKTTTSAAVGLLTKI